MFERSRLRGPSPPGTLTGIRASLPTYQVELLARRPEHHGRPQVVCILSLGYGLVNPNHGTGGMIEGLPFHPSPHSCRNPLRANLVLPGESLFFYAPITVPDWAGPDADLMFDVSLAELPRGQWVTLGTGATLPAARAR